MSFYDQDFDDWYEPEHAELVLPPLMQWRRGDLTNRDERLKDGCFQLPVDRFKIENLQPVEVVHGAGKVVPSYLFKGLRLAILAWRKDWFTGKGRDRKPVYVYNENISPWSRIQIWAYVKLDPEPLQFILTFNKANSMGIEDTINRFKERVISPVSAKAKRALPLYAFWCPVGPGEKVEYPQNGTYSTPPKLWLPKGDPEDLFVGPQLVKQFAKLYPQAKAWADKEFKAGLEDNSEHSEPERQINGRPPMPEPPPNLPDEEPVGEDPYAEIPF